jgi:methylenetetrahydrofolate dehydrogenase (NADP+)/methenyltetrahydrofolate cyclohydrolase
MILLNSVELVEKIKKRHTRQVGKLIKEGIRPKLAIIQVNDDPVINTYVRLKKKYGADIGIDVDIYTPKQADTPKLINKLNRDKTVHGMIVQLPLVDPRQTDEIVNLIAPQKDVDALGQDAPFDPATPTAILWLLAGYGIDLKDKEVVIIGRGKLVGAPLRAMLERDGIQPKIGHRGVEDLKAMTLTADVIISAANNPGILKADMVKTGAVVVDAGTANEEGKTVGNAAPELYDRDDITITPTRGGVGPLTVCALFENVIHGASRNS